MKSLQVLMMSFGVALLISAVTFLPVYALAFVSGSSTDIASLSVVGKNFTCEWVSEDGKSAVFLSDWGLRRLIEFDRPGYAESGKKYTLKFHPPTHKFGGTKHTLVPV